MLLTAITVLMSAARLVKDFCDEKNCIGVNRKSDFLSAVRPYSLSCQNNRLAGYGQYPQYPPRVPMYPQYAQPQVVFYVIQPVFVPQSACNPARTVLPQAVSPVGAVPIQNCNPYL